MDKEIIEGNRLIAEFMGVKVLEADNGDPVVKNTKGVFRHIKDWTKYHSDWSWLMHVVEKIEALGFDFVINGKGAFVYSPGNIMKGKGSYLETKLKACYATVVKFIKWYNTQTQQQ